MDKLFKCKACPSMERFMSYVQCEDLTLHFLCESTSPSYYDKLPFLKELSKYDTYNRLMKIRTRAILFSIGALMLLILASITQNPMLLFIVVAFMIMGWYVFYQIVSDDIANVRVFELSFSNKAFMGLKNMSVANNHNQLIELNTPVNYDDLLMDKSGWRLLIYIRNWIKYVEEKWLRRKMVVSYIFDKKEKVVIDTLSKTEVERNLVTGLKELETYLADTSFKISRIFIIKDKNGDTHVREIINPQISSKT